MPRIQHKRGTSANLASVNPTPLAGELVWDSTENAIKIGDGATAWTSLAYVTATPRTHTHSADAITSGTIDYARLPVGSTSSTVCAGDDARLSDARSPTAHKSSHATGGSDALTPADIGAAPAASPAITGNATFEASSGVPVTITNTGTGNSFVVNDAAGDTTPFVVDASGKVAIGSSAGHASRGLLIKGADFSSGSILLQSSATPAGNDVGFLLLCGNNLSYVWNYESNPILFGTGNAERMRLTAAGDLGLGPSRTAPASRLDVNGVITVSATSGSAGSYAPSLTFSGDANTGFGQVSGQSDTASIFTAGSERVRVDASGRFLVGATSGRNLGGFTPSLIEGTDANGSRLAVVQNTNNTAGAGINLCKSRGTSVGSITIVQSGDTLGSVFFNGADGTDLSSVGASVSAQVDGTPAANDLPGRLVFSTTASGSQIPTERVRIKSTGAVRFVPLSADPASGEAGDVYYNSSTNKLRVYDGTSWVDLH